MAHVLTDIETLNKFMEPAYRVLRSSQRYKLIDKRDAKQLESIEYSMKTIEDEEVFELLEILSNEFKDFQSELDVKRFKLVLTEIDERMIRLVNSEESDNESVETIREAINVLEQDRKDGTINSDFFIVDLDKIRSDVSNSTVVRRYAQRVYVAIESGKYNAETVDSLRMDFESELKDINIYS